MTEIEQATEETAFHDKPLGSEAAKKEKIADRVRGALPVIRVFIAFGALLLATLTSLFCFADMTFFQTASIDLSFLNLNLGQSANVFDMLFGKFSQITYIFVYGKVTPQYVFPGAIFLIISAFMTLFTSTFGIIAAIWLLPFALKNKSAKKLNLLAAVIIALLTVGIAVFSMIKGYYVIGYSSSSLSGSVARMAVFPGAGAFVGILLSSILLLANYVLACVEGGTGHRLPNTGEAAKLIGIVFGFVACCLLMVGMYGYLLNLALPLGLTSYILVFCQIALTAIRSGLSLFGLAERTDFKGNKVLRILHYIISIALILILIVVTIDSSIIYAGSDYEEYGIFQGALLNIMVTGVVSSLLVLASLIISGVQSRKR